MAVDTETRRRSVSGYTGTLVYPVADGTIDANDREHVASLYAGITAGEPPVVYGLTYHEVEAVFRLTQEREMVFRLTQEKKLRF